MHIESALNMFDLNGTDSSFNDIVRITERTNAYIPAMEYHIQPETDWLAEYFSRTPLYSHNGYYRNIYYPYKYADYLVIPLTKASGNAESDYSKYYFLYEGRMNQMLGSPEYSKLSLAKYIEDQSYGEHKAKFHFPNGANPYSPLTEYKVTNGDDPTHTINEVYHNMYNLHMITEENAYWKGQLPNGSPAQKMWPIIMPGQWDTHYAGISGDITINVGESSDYFMYAIIARELYATSHRELKSNILHEMMHFYGFPDLYSIRLKDGYFSINGDIMARGMKMSGFHKFVLGWCPIIQIKHDVESHLQKAFEFKENKREIYGAFPKGLNGPEFFILELNYPMVQYYSSKGYINAVPDNDIGLAIWHIDLSMLNTAIPDRPHMALERSSGDPQWWPEGEIPPASDSYPDYFGFSYTPKRFAHDTTPSSVLYTGTASGVEVDIKFFSGNDAKLWHFTKNRHGDPVAIAVIDVDVGSPLLGDVNGDGIVNEGDAAMLRLNMGRRVGIDALAVPVDVNGDGFLKLVYDRDEDGFIATSERIYDTAWNLVHTSGDWLDINGDGKNDLDAAGTGQFDAIERWYEEFRKLNKEHPPKGGISTRNPPVPWHEMSPGLFEVSARSTGQGLALASKPIAAWIIDQNEDGIIDFFDAEGDGMPTLVPARLDADGDGVITEMDAAYMGYYWGETTFEELWIPLPAPSWANY